MRKYHNIRKNIESHGESRYTSFSRYNTNVTKNYGKTLGLQKPRKNGIKITCCTIFMPTWIVSEGWGNVRLHDLKWQGKWVGVTNLTLTKQ